MKVDRPEPHSAAEVRGAVRVPAKINLFLSVRGRRDDGMHEVVTVLQTVTLHDRVTATVRGSPAVLNHPAARKLMEIELEQAGGVPAPPGDDNMVVRAATLLRELSGRSARPGGAGARQAPVTRLSLRKDIPVAAGMGGGSADAAATLVLLNELWDLDLDRDELCAVAGRLGADVPFCVTGGTARATGTGRSTARVLCRGDFHWLACIDDRPLATADVYRTWDEVGVPDRTEPDAVFEALGSGDPQALGAALHNGLDVATFRLRPDLQALRDRLEGAGALGTIVSGSGPTMLALASSAAHAHAIAADVRDAVARTEVIRSPGGGPEFVREDGAAS